MRQAIFSVLIDGNNLTTKWAQFLQSLTVKLDDEGSMDEATIDLNDAYAQLGLPRKAASVDIELGWSDIGVVKVFTGFVDEVRWHYARGSGRVLTVHCKSGDMSGSLKETMQDSMDNATLGDVAQKWGQQAGLSSVLIASSLGSILRPYWQIGESFLTWIERRSHEVGGSFKVVGTRGVLVARNGGTSASGAALVPIVAECGVNVIEISASPILARPEYGKTATRWYDPVDAMWKEETGASKRATGGAKHLHQFKAPSQDQAKQQSDSNADEIDRERGGAENVTIDGEPVAQPVAACTVAGARPGVDGIYSIAQVVHSLTRSGGFTTQLTLKNPSGDAGIDTRTAGEGDANETPVTTPVPTTGGGIGGLPPDQTPGSGGIGSA